MAATSTVVSFRLNPKKRQDLVTIQILQDRIDEGKSQGMTIGVKEVIMDALNRASGYPLELHQDTYEQDLIAKIQELQNGYQGKIKEIDWDKPIKRLESVLEDKMTEILADFSKHLTQSILSDIRSGKIDPHAEKPFGDEDQEEEEMRQRMAAAMQTRQRNKKE